MFDKTHLRERTKLDEPVVAKLPSCCVHSFTEQGLLSTTATH
jgi:hypothetical protein